MRFNSTTAALTILAAALGTALFSQIRPVQAETVATTEAEASPVMAVEAVYSPPQAISTGGMALPDFRTIVRNNTDAIVKIEVVQNAREMTAEEGQEGGSGDPMEEFLRRFGGVPGAGSSHTRNAPA